MKISNDMTGCLTSAKLETDKTLLLLDLLLQEYLSPEKSQEWNYRQMTIFIDQVQNSVGEIDKCITRAIRLDQAGSSGG